MAKRRTIKEPETKGRVTVKEARATAGKYRSAATGRYVTRNTSAVKKPKR